MARSDIMAWYAVQTHELTRALKGNADARRRIGELTPKDIANLDRTQRLLLKSILIDMPTVGRHFHPDTYMGIMTEPPLKPPVRLDNRGHGTGLHTHDCGLIF